MPMALRVPSGSDAWPPTPCAVMRASGWPSSSPAGSTSKFSGTDSAWASARTTAWARLGTAFTAEPPASSRMRAPATEPATGLDENVPWSWPFSPQQTGNSASGVKRKSGCG